MLEARELECIRGDRRLFSALSLKLDGGGLLHVQGRNGSGKSTLLRALCGLFQPSTGEVCWNGVNIRELREEYSREILYIGHKAAIKDELSALENLRIGSRLGGHPVSEGQAMDALEAIGLAGFEELPCKHLSQGQKRRVALARLRLAPARLWILDEPFVALDRHACDALQTLISSHLFSSGMVILTTHQEVQLAEGNIQRLELGDERHGEQAHV